VSGYLARIVERALSTAPVVHSRASLPFVQPPEIQGEDAATPAAAREASAPARHPSPGEMSPPTGPAKRPNASRATPPGVGPMALEDDTADAASRQPPQEDRVARAARPRPAQDDPARTQSVPRRQPQALSEWPVAGLDRAGSDAPGVPSPSPGDRMAARAAPRGPGPAAHIAKAVATLPSQGGRAREEPAAPPDVHIHIGRIEISAMAAPPPAPRKPPAKAGKPPMPLDEYLRRRDGGAR
jgi:hypothetical protein